MTKAVDMLTRKELSTVLQESGTPSKALDWLIGQVLFPGKYLDIDRTPNFTTSLDAAVSLIPPNWFWTAGLCALTGHTTIGPDYNGPAGEQLYRDFPSPEWHTGISYDLPPGDGVHRTCMAICCAVLDVPDLTKPGPYHRAVMESADITLVKLSEIMVGIDPAGIGCDTSVNFIPTEPESK